MSDLIVDNSFSKLNCEIEDNSNKLKLILRNLSLNNSNSDFFRKLHDKAIKSKDVIERINFPSEINLKHSSIDCSALSLINDFSRVKILKKNYELRNLLNKKVEIYKKLLQDKEVNAQLSQRLSHVGKAAKLHSLQKQMKLVKENVVNFRNQIDLMKSQAVTYKINKRNFENDKISVKNIIEEIDDNAEKISLKTETCLRKMIGINHQIDSGKNLFEDMQKIFLLSINLNEKIFISINEQLLNESICLDPINTVTHSNCKLYPTILAFFQLFIKNEKSSHMIEKSHSEYENISNEFEMIGINIEKFKDYYGSINRKSAEDLICAKSTEKAFWSKLTQFESVAKEWEVLKKVAFK